jgi:hypothetical protein
VGILLIKWYASGDRSEQYSPRTLLTQQHRPIWSNYVVKRRDRLRVPPLPSCAISREYKPKPRVLGEVLPDGIRIRLTRRHDICASACLDRLGKLV